MTDLASWHARLAQHFAQLSAARKVAVGDRPVFALEHGLDAAELDALARAVRAHIVDVPPSMDHALAWIVYAAEIGYGYSGDEYWQTFEDQTPFWTLRGDRCWIRNCYRMFEREYGGVRPSGPWAAHFSIICWPITHAILPRDLQRQLARILYELRDSFSADLFESPPKLGEFIAARSWNCTSRFQNFAQETHLVGQIAAALLLQGQPGTDILIHPATLQRIGADLDRERRAREWLRRARRVAQERTNIRGLALGRGAASSAVSSQDEAREEAAALGIEPRFVLRPKASDASRWEVSLEIPDLSHLLFKFPKTRDVLTGSRCIVAGASGRPLARGRCLHGSQRVVLSRWPQDDEVLLQFEQLDAQLEYLLRAECLLRPGPLWLFRIASDGLAYESRSLGVRPRERYILVTTDGPIRSDDHCRAIDVECERVHAALLDLPAALTSDWEDALRRLGLRQSKVIEVWPVGLGAVVWDGEGHGEWLASERPCLAIQTDHPIAALLVSLGTEPDRSFELTSVTPGEPIFVQLPQLPVGLHTVRIRARSSVSSEVEPLGDLDVVMRIREARSLSAGLSPHGPLVVEIDPAVPTLEQLWEGRVEIRMRGPAGRHVKCTVSLRDSGGGKATVMKRLPTIPLPVTADTWRRHFEKYFQEKREVSPAYYTARLCDVEFTCDELGAFTIRCEREFTPLRWAVQRNGLRYFVRLLDDSGNTQPPQVVRMAFETPLVKEPLSTEQAYQVPAAGGLYVARGGTASAGVITPPSVRELADFRCDPRIEARGRSTDSILDALTIARTWGVARLPGDVISAKRRRDVLRALALYMVRIIGGDTWASAELSVGNPDGLTHLKRAISKRREEAGIGSALDGAALSGATCEERVRHLTSLMTGLHVLPAGQPHRAPSGNSIFRRGSAADERDPGWLTELALRLASDPTVVEEWAGDFLRAGASRLLDVPTLVRAARFLVITTDRHLNSSAAPGELYATWRWA